MEQQQSVGLGGGMVTFVPYSFTDKNTWPCIGPAWWQHLGFKNGREEAAYVVGLVDGREHARFDTMTPDRDQPPMGVLVDVAPDKLPVMLTAFMRSGWTVTPWSYPDNMVRLAVYRDQTQQTGSANGG